MKNLISNLIIKDVFLATTIYTEENSKNVQHSRPRWAIIIKYEGETIYTQPPKEIISNVNNIIILPKGCSYEWNCTKSGHFSVIEFDCDLTDKNIYSFYIKNSEKILKKFKALEYIRFSKQPMYKMESIKEAYSIILKLLYSSEYNYTPHYKEKKLLPVIEYISKNYNNNIKNDDLAELIGVSTVYFRKLFTEVYGISPINYVKNIRMKKAKEMLQSDYGSIANVALTLGYSNIYDFSRDFKNHIGVSPSKFNRDYALKKSRE